MEGSDKRTSRPKARQSIANIPSSSQQNKIDKQNVTIDFSATRKAQEPALMSSRKRTRGKSLGPGGLEALQGTNGSISKSVSVFQPRSILKPTLPLTPPKNIPTFDELRQKSTRKKSPAKNATEALLIDFSTPGPGHDSHRSMPVVGVQDVLDPFSPIKIINPTSKMNNPVADCVDEADMQEQRRREQKQAILEQRAARRKSMANRRVSFAPEATLHTWSVMEMVEDSTTSSASNSTRRQSSMTAEQTSQRNQQFPIAESKISEPLTPLQKTEQLLVRASPAHQQDLQQKERKSSATSEDIESSSDEVYSSSPSGDVATESSPIRVEDSIDSDSDTDGDTAMSMEEITQDTAISEVSSSSTRSSLEERLRQAADQAGTRGIEYDEYGDDMSMEIASDTVTKAFKPWVRNEEPPRDPRDDQENVKPFSPVRKAQEIQEALQQNNEDYTDLVTMDITRTVGGILDINALSPSPRQKSSKARRGSSFGRRRSIAADSSYGDESMDLTMAAGGILSVVDQRDCVKEHTSDEEMTMELTTAVGGLQKQSRRESMQSTVSEGNETMDMTAAIGGILAPIEEQTEPQTDNEIEKTMTMEMTNVIGQTLSRDTINTSFAGSAIGNVKDTTGIDFVALGSSLPEQKKSTIGTPQKSTFTASAMDESSSSLETQTPIPMKSEGGVQATTPQSSKNTPTRTSSIKKPATPTKQLTPMPTQARTPERTPLSAQVIYHGASPQKLFEAEIQAKTSTASIRKLPGKQQDLLFAQDEVTGRQTPRVVLHAPKPHQHLRRRSSGIGIDMEGFGSPSITKLLAHRSSIGEAAPRFRLESSQTPRLRFENPKQLAEELEAERVEDERRESGRFILEQEANEQQEENTTSQLIDLIGSMSPHKNRSTKLKGRKSLAVGSARGLLGKRPMELDEDDEDGDNITKRLKTISKDGSPIKKIHLPKPPSKEETTGRLTKAQQNALDSFTSGEHTPTLVISPSKLEISDSPKHSNRYRDVSQDCTSSRPTSFGDKLDNVIGAVDPFVEHLVSEDATADEDKISLQQFLNMTNIHFIELNTTKRRHTLAQAITNGDRQGEIQQSNSISSCFIAATSTMPVLELYQHATRELKSYISTGRKIIRSIESETLAEQPALFREYIEARPDIKLVMDNQFRNGKTNARLQSKEGWYTWRSQLVDGLRSGLEGIQNDIKKDVVTVEEQVEALTQAVPELVSRRDSLTQTFGLLQQRLCDIESIDHQALKGNRKHLMSLNHELLEKLTMLELLQQQMHDKDEALLQAAELKAEMQDQIVEANRFCEEQRGWAAKDVILLKTRMESFKNQAGWCLISAEEDPDEPHNFGVALTMSYKDRLRLYFHPFAFDSTPSSSRRRSGRSSQSSQGQTAPISLTLPPLYEDDTTACSLPTETRFFVQFLQSQLFAFAMMPKGSVLAKKILDTISAGWEIACKVSEEIRLLSLVGITRVSIVSDEELSVKLMLMINDGSRVDIEFILMVKMLVNGEVSVTTSTGMTAIYGHVAKILDISKTRKVQKALNKEVDSDPIGKGAWIRAVQAFEEWHRFQIHGHTEDKSEPKKEGDIADLEQIQAGSTTPTSPIRAPSKVPTVKRSPLAAKKSSTVQKKTIPIPTARQDRFKNSQREREQPATNDKIQMSVDESYNDKENINPSTYGSQYKPPAITPEMQEAMMQRTPIKRLGALRRSPV